MKVIVRKMIEEEFEHWLNLSTKRQAQDRASITGRTAEQERTELNQILPILLPDGKTTKGHYFYTIDTDSETNIGFIWFGGIPGLPDGNIY